MFKFFEWNIILELVGNRKIFLRQDIFVKFIITNIYFYIQ